MLHRSFGGGFFSLNGRIVEAVKKGTNARRGIKKRTTALCRLHGKQYKIHLTNNFVLTFVWFLSPRPFFSSEFAPKSDLYWLHISPRLCHENEQTQPRCVSPDCSLPTRWPQQHLAPSATTRTVGLWGCSVRPAAPPALHQTPPCQHASSPAAESSTVWDYSKTSVFEKREHMSVHYIFIHTLRHVPTPETHTVCFDFLTPACFANLLSAPSIPSPHFISILFKGNAAYCKLETLTSGQQATYWEAAVGAGGMGHSSFPSSAPFPSTWNVSSLWSFCSLLALTKRRRWPRCRNSRTIDISLDSNTMIFFSVVFKAQHFAIKSLKTWGK